MAQYVLLNALAAAYLVLYAALAAAAARGTVDFGNVGAAVEADARATALLEPDPASFYPLIGDAANKVREGEPYAHLARLNDTTFEEFSEYVRRGQPVIVDDVARGWPLNGWSCEDFAAAFPSGNMKAEYDQDVGQGRASLGDDDWIKNPRSSGQDLDAHPDRAESAPYIWHVKDEETAENKAKMQGLYRAPYFLQDIVNRKEFNDSMEIWFSPGAAGAMAHADSYCEPTWSVQLHGDKRWRMMTTLPAIPTVFDRFVYFDEGIYEVGKWKPDYEFVVKEGGGVMFPPGNFHETRALARDSCTTATTVQMQLPNPTRYIRHFLPRLLSSHLGIDETCWERWDSYATFRPNDDTPGPTLDEGTWRARVRALGAQLDADGDGFIARAELLAHFGDARSGADKPETQWARDREHWYGWTVQGDAQEAALHDMMGRTRALDTLGYHDLDGDGRISPEELWRATAAWNVVRHKMLATHEALVNLVMRKKGAARADGIKTLVALELGYQRTYAVKDGGDGAATEAELQRKAALYMRRGAPKALPEENDQVAGSKQARRALKEALAKFVSGPADDDEIASFGDMDWGKARAAAAAAAAAREDKKEL